jgi:hypothetical protein
MTDDETRPRIAKPRKIKLMTTYFGSGVWYGPGEGGIGPMDLHTLGLSPELAHDIEAWQEHFDIHAGTGDGWDSDEAAAWNRTTGRLLLERVQVELEPDVTVSLDL